MTIFRVYENGRPLKVAHHLELSPTGTKDGDLVFTSGHPGTTQRPRTMAHLEVLRGAAVPAMVEMLERRQAALKPYGAAGPEQARQVGTNCSGSKTAWSGRRASLVRGQGQPRRVGRFPSHHRGVAQGVRRNAPPSTRFSESVARRSRQAERGKITGLREEP